jgi:hypothetical protein
MKERFLAWFGCAPWLSLIIRRVAQCEPDKASLPNGSDISR